MTHHTITDEQLKALRARLQHVQFINDDNSVDRHLDDILSLLETIEKQTESAWRGIETAPRDGSHILLYVDGDSLGYKKGSMARIIGYYAKQFTLPAHDDVHDPSKYPDDFEYQEESGDWFSKPNWFVIAFENQYGDDIAKVVKPTHWMHLPLPPQKKGNPNE